MIPLSPDVCLTGVEISPPLSFDIEVSDLPPDYARSVRRAVSAGYIDGYLSDGELWVRRVDLQDIVSPGHCTYDELDECCYIPPEIVRDHSQA